MVPESVREKYDHYKMIDTSRGKVRYWESSAKKIGLQNNPDRYVKRKFVFVLYDFFYVFAEIMPPFFRYDGIIFANTAWRG